ncbi:MAG: RNA-directed DNA polymerase [Mycobacterium sp.]
MPQPQAQSPPPLAPPPPALRYDDARHDAWVAALKSADFRRQLDAALTQPGPAAAAAVADLLREAARTVFGARPSAGRPAPAAQQQDQPWFRHCRGEYAALQAAARQRLGAAELRRRRNRFNAAKRRAQRRWRAEQNNRLMGTLRGKPRAFWTAYKRDDSATVDGGASLEDHAAHWRAQLGPAGCGALEETGAAGPRQLAAELEAAAAGPGPGAAAGGGGSGGTGGGGGNGGGPTAARRRAAAQLEEPFTGDEVWAQVKRMRAGAAPGLDGLGACLLKNAFEEVEDSEGRTHRNPLLADSLALLFTQIARTRYPSHWNEQPLTPVFKGKGSASDLHNYRPIQSQCALAKLFSMVLHARLNAFAEGQGLRAMGQAGFRDRRRASDNIFILRHLIDRARHAPPPRQRLFACFVDFEKAYDSIHRDALMRYLASVGIGGNTLSTLCDMYWQVRARPKLRGCLGPAFSTTCGVRQGDPLSPLLFGMYIDRIEAHLARHVREVGATLSGLSTPLQVLLYADDLVLLCHSAAGLQALLDSLRAFCEAHHLRVNVSKTEVVVFGRRARGASADLCGATPTGGQVLPLPRHSAARHLRGPPCGRAPPHRRPARALGPAGPVQRLGCGRLFPPCTPLPRPGGAHPHIRGRGLGARPHALRA